MILYHGSNLEVNHPQILYSKRKLDFGTGFYLTTDYGQAQKWAARTYKRREEGHPVVSAFFVDENNFKLLDVLIFDSANKDWLRYISRNRTDTFVKDSHDVVIGPVANDQAIRTINNYLNGYFSEDIAIQLLLPQNLKDQYAFKTDQALSVLKFKEAII
ncbi:MAG: DUF3990 domain-containing protein [Clostridiales bacterium]|nr:DUF3990 domain-containing protein [Clostridiales bacterium]